MYLNNCNLLPNSRYEGQARDDKSSPAVKLAFEGSRLNNMKFSITLQTDAQGRPVHIVSPGPGSEEHPDEMDIQSIKRVG
jgi:hypothetical protein